MNTKSGEVKNNYTGKFKECYYYNTIAWLNIELPLPTKNLIYECAFERLLLIEKDKKQHFGVLLQILAYDGIVDQIDANLNLTSET